MPRTLRPKLWRLQFSLRALLLLITLGGCGLWVYRWPWQVTRLSANLESTTTTYRRSWNGTPLKHGRQIVVGENRQLLNEVVYHDGIRLVDRQFHPNGSLAEETTYPAPGNVACVRRFKTVGEELIIREERIALDAPRIATMWRTSDGRKLQSADYEAGVLVRWNDLPIDVAMQRAVAQVNDPNIRAGWLAECHPSDTSILEEVGENTFRETCWLGRYVADDGRIVSAGETRSTIELRIFGCGALQREDVHFFFSSADNYVLGSAGQIVTKAHFPALLKRLLAVDYTLVVRDGVVCAAPINAEHLLD